MNSAENETAFKKIAVGLLHIKITKFTWIWSDNRKDEK